MQWWSINLSESPIKRGTQTGSFSASMVQNKGNYKERNTNIQLFEFVIDEAFSHQICEEIASFSQEVAWNALLKCDQAA